MIICSIKNCRLCGSSELDTIFDFGNFPLAGIYYDKIEEKTEITAPMTLIRCKKCGHVQLKETCDPEIYQDYSFSGQQIPSYCKYMEIFSNQLVEKFKISEKKIFEVGASDGFLLKLLRDDGKNFVDGIEPSTKLCLSAEKKNVHLYNDYFNKKFYDKIEKKFDCIIVRHVLEHIDDLNSFFYGLKKILEDDGFLFIEVPYLKKTLSNSLFSNFFHEHINYFTLKTLSELAANYGFELLTFQENEIHGGSIFTVFKKTFNATRLNFDDEEKVVLKDLQNFKIDFSNYLIKLNNKIKTFKNEEIFHGYGAAQRTFNILKFLNLDYKKVPIIYDLNKNLQGKYLNYFHSKIISPEDMLEYNPSTVIIFASSYEDEIAHLIKEKIGSKVKILSMQI